MKRIVFLLITFFFQFSSLHLFAQKTNSVYWSYIQKYNSMAQDQMVRHGIPASITLAQGLLESGAGRSELATKANNHFGIKLGSDWKGPYIVRRDDGPHDKFRKYNSVAESYEDHSLFLKKPRYAELFKLSSTDYKGWAKGLKKCGYATSPTYAQQLINIIEDYGLHQYDSSNKKYVHSYNAYTSTQATTVTVPATTTKHQTTKRTPATTAKPSMRELAEQLFFAQHPVYACNKNYYIVVQSGDNLPTISLMTGVSKRKLRKYNELPKDYVPHAGDILYLQKKHSKADKSYKGIPHVVQAGESMYDIAQHYGMRVESLYKLNDLPVDYAPQVGHMLRVY